MNSKRARIGSCWRFLPGLLFSLWCTGMTCPCLMIGSPADSPSIDSCRFPPIDKALQRIKPFLVRSFSWNRQLYSKLGLVLRSNYSLLQDCCKNLALYLRLCTHFSFFHHFKYQTKWSFCVRKSIVMDIGSSWSREQYSAVVASCAFLFMWQRESARIHSTSLVFFFARLHRLKKRALRLFSSFRPTKRSPMKFTWNRCLSFLIFYTLNCLFKFEIDFDSIKNYS